MIRDDGTIPDRQALRVLVGTGHGILQRWAAQGAPLPETGPIPAQPLLEWLRARGRPHARRLAQAWEAHVAAQAAAPDPADDGLAALDEQALRRLRLLAQTRQAQLDAAQAEGSLLPLARVRAALSAYAARQAALLDALVRAELLAACDGHPQARGAIMAAHERGRLRLRADAAAALRDCLGALVERRHD